MANHHTGETNLHRETNGSFVDGSFSFRAERHFQPGSEFVFSYDDGGTPGVGGEWRCTMLSYRVFVLASLAGRVGAKCDHHLLSDYGFLPGAEGPEETAMCVPLSLSIPMQQLPEWKQALFHEAGLLTQQTAILADGAPSAVTMAVLRLALLDSEEEALSAAARWREGASEDEEAREGTGWLLQSVNELNEIQSLGCVPSL